ncbi:MAG: flippase-like domain-containing protein [Saprospiraceae bacterium]|nr:flippase-like domain-containing protein [Saprospiraceae bacterium]
MKKDKIKEIAKFLIFFITGVFLLYYVFLQQGADWNKIYNDFARINYFWIVMVILSYLLSNVSRSIRWQMLIKPLGYEVKFSNSFMATMIGYYANTIIPRAGEVARPGILHKYEKIPMDKLLGTIFVDRLLDALSLLILIGLAFIFEFDKLWGYFYENSSINANEHTTPFWQSSWFIFFMIATVLTVVGIFFYWDFLKQSKIFKYGIQKAKGFWTGVTTLKHIDNIGLFIIHSILIWLGFYLMTYLCFFAFPPMVHLSPVVGLVVIVCGTLGMIVPTPGGVGTYQYMVTTALSLFYGIDKTEAFTFSNITFFAIFILNVLVGFLCYAILPITNRGYHPQHYHQQNLYNNIK